MNRRWNKSYSALPPFSAVLFKPSRKKVLILLLGALIYTGRGHGETGTPSYLNYNKETSRNRDAKILTVPEVEEGVPEAGKRVKIYLPEYPEAYYVLFLPYNFTNTVKFPVIFESPGNVYQEVSSGLPDSACLGYGISFGMDYIWVCVPFVDNTGHILRSFWDSDPLSSVNFWLAVLNDLNAKFRIDNDKIVLSGFSRGAISTSYVGNYNDEISSKWAAYFAHSHFDGCCQTLLGSTEERLNRIQKKKVLISAGALGTAKKCSWEAYTKLSKEEYSVTYIEVPDLGHSPFWILEDSGAAKEARIWLRNLFPED